MANRKQKYLHAMASLSDRYNAIKSGWLQRILTFAPLYWVTGAILFLLALGLNFFRLGVPSIWFDEAFSVELARQPLPLLWHIIFGPEPNMELYYLFLHGWLSFTGWLGFHPTEAVVRFPSAIFAACASLIVFMLGRRFLGLPAAIVASLLYLLNDLQLVYAQQTRSYALQLLLICLSWYMLLRVISSENRTRCWWIIYVASTVLAIYAHLFSLLIWLAQLVAMGSILLLPNIYRKRARQQLWSLLVSLLAISLLIAPMLLESREGAKTGWLEVPHREEIHLLFIAISGNSGHYFYAFIGCVILGAGLIFLAYLLYSLSVFQNFLWRCTHLNTYVRSVQRLAPFAWAMFCWLFIPLVVSYVVSQGSLRIFSTRYLVTIVPPLFLLVGLGIVMIRWRVLQAFFSVVILILAVSVVPLYYRSAQVEDWNVTHWLLEHSEPGDGIVCYDNDINQGCQISVEYYLHAYSDTIRFESDAPGAFSWTTYGPTEPAEGFEAAVDPASLRTYAQKHKRLFFIIGRLPDDAAMTRAQSAQQWLDEQYHYVDQIVSRTVTIRLYIIG